MKIMSNFNIKYKLGLIFAAVLFFLFGLIYTDVLSSLILTLFVFLIMIGLINKAEKREEKINRDKRAKRRKRIRTHNY